MKIVVVPRLDALLRFMTIALSMIIICATTLYAQDAKNAADASPNATPAPRPSGMSERELYLLNEIDLLKNRLVELESHVATSPVKAAAPVVTTTQALDPAEVAATAPPQNGSQAEPFAFADFSWLTGNSRTKESPMDTKVFTGELRVDSDYVHDFNHPKDNTIGGSSEVFRSGEFHLTQFGIGGDFHW